MRFKKEITTLIFVLVLGLFGTFATAQENTKQLFDAAMERATKLESQLEVADPKNEMAEAAANSVANQFRSSEFQQRLTREQNRIQRTLLGGYTEGLLEGGTGEEGQLCTDALLPDEKLYILISSSMPLETLRAYARDLDHLQDPNITLVLRGFVGGMKLVQPTLDFIQKITAKDRDCPLGSADCDHYRINIDIDPLVFRLFGVQQVPAFVFAKGVDLIDSEQSIGNGGNLKNEISPEIIYGDASLNHILEKLFTRTENPRIEAAVQKLNRGYYGQN